MFELFILLTGIHYIVGFFLSFNAISMIIGNNFKADDKFGDLSDGIDIKYRMRTNIGMELNLVNWRIAMQSPSLNFANIFFYSISSDPNCF